MLAILRYTASDGVGSSVMVLIEGVRIEKGSCLLVRVMMYGRIRRRYPFCCSIVQLFRFCIAEFYAQNSGCDSDLILYEPNLQDRRRLPKRLQNGGRRYKFNITDAVLNLIGTLLKLNLI